MKTLSLAALVSLLTLPLAAQRNPPVAVHPHAEQARRQADDQLVQVERAVQLAQAPTKLAEPPEAPEPPEPAELPAPAAAEEAGWALAGDMFHGMFGGSERAVAPLVIRNNPADADALASVQEDLTVMTRILNKAVSKAAGREKPDQASGILVTLGGVPQRPQSFYLEGYGALFLVNVGFPLVAPPSSATKAEAAKPADTEWEKARRELYAPRQQPAAELFLHAPEAPVEYDAERVENLKRNLLEALKNGANIHALKGEEWITVAVTGPNGGSGRRGRDAMAADDAIARRYGLRSGRHGAHMEGQPGAGEDRPAPRATQLIVRVKRPDAEAYAKGAVGYEVFRKQAVIQNY